ncbi:RING finger protein 145 [Engraulis encrasicolus]|uniref:RING finger protein 145 n=1 Tax=Engraulis encrasicolus TaxID=184585 RepID=UPI002FD53430
MSWLENVANVALRVPSLLALDLLYKCDIESFTEHIKARNEDMLFKYKYVIWNVYYVGQLLSMVMLVLPLGHIVQLYLHVLTGLLLYVGHHNCRDYIQAEMRYGEDRPLYLDSHALNSFVSTLTGQVIVSTLCAFLMRTRQVWLFSAHLLPLVARACCLPLDTVGTVASASMVISCLQVAAFLLSHMFLPYRLAKAAYTEVQEVGLQRLFAVCVSVWQSFSVPLLFSVFWLLLFGAQLCSPATSHQGLLLFLLGSVSESCSTPYSLMGLACVVSYVALGLMNLCKFFLGGYAAVQNHNVMHSGVTEGVTLLLLALQTGLLDMSSVQRSFLLSIILFIILTSTLQNMIEITEPIVLALAASRNRSVWKHLRGLSMCVLLLLSPILMAYKLSQFFVMDLWLLILLSSCILTSLQVTGTLLVYGLFMLEVCLSTAIAGLDEVVYYVNGVCRALEFLLAVCVVLYGAWECLFGEWSWLGASVLIVHSYCSVWLRARAGWSNFLLRREAARKINQLPRATPQQLKDHNDVCAICYQDMSSAVITYCGHYFHGNCLRKWLYVQETCPMCHAPIKQATPTQTSAATGDDAPQDEVVPNGEDNDDIDDDNDNGSSSEGVEFTEDELEQEQEQDQEMEDSSDKRREEGGHAHSEGYISSSECTNPPHTRETDAENDKGGSSEGEEFTEVEEEMEESGVKMEEEQHTHSEGNTPAHTPPPHTLEATDKEGLASAAPCLGSNGLPPSSPP